MRLMTKAAVCRELAVSLSTLDRRIAAGELLTRRKPRGRRRRVYVMLDDDPLEEGKAVNSVLAVAQERIRRPEEQVALLQGQLELEQERNAELANELVEGRDSTRETRPAVYGRVGLAEDARQLRRIDERHPAEAVEQLSV